MPQGHYTIGDLTFTFEGSLKELAHCQEIMREIRQAEGRLKKHSGASQVKLIYDQDLEGEQGTFDKMRLRAHTSERNYTIDIGATDNNPLGVYVGHDTPVDVYDREAERVGEIPVGAEEVQWSGSGRSQPGQNGEPAQGEQAAQDTGVDGTPSDDRIVAMRDHLLAKIEGTDDDREAGEVTLESGATLAAKLNGFAGYVGRSAGYVKRVLDVHGVESFEVLHVAQARQAIRQIAHPEQLEMAEEDTDLPF